MNIDLPLILTIIVGVSGIIWLLDSVFLSRPRAERLAALQQQFPKWNDRESADAKLFIDAATRDASEPVIVEYAKSFFPYWRLFWYFAHSSMNRSNPIILDGSDTPSWGLHSGQ